MNDLYLKKKVIDANYRNTKIYSKYMDVKQSMNFDNFVPSVQFDENQLIEELKKTMDTFLREKMKFKVPLESILLETVEEKPDTTLETADFEKPQIDKKSRKRGKSVMGTSVSQLRRDSTGTSFGQSHRGSVMNSSEKLNDSKPKISINKMDVNTEAEEVTIEKKSVCVTIEIGTKKQKEIIVPYITYATLFPDLVNEIDLDRGKVTLNRVNDLKNTRAGIIRQLFPSVEILKRLSVSLKLL